MRIENGNVKKKDISYKDYESKLENRKKWSSMTFLSVFGVLLIIFLGFAKLMSPDVDISLGEDEDVQMEDVDNSGYRGEVDARLKELQREDEGELAPSSDAAVEEDGLVRIPKKNEEPVSEKVEDSVFPVEQNANAVKPQQNQPSEAPAPTPTAPQAQPSATYRVLVGMYATQAQAEVAKGILQDAGLGVTPRVRQSGSGYTLQVGAFSSKESATNLSNKLLMNNYPARITVSD